MSETLESRMHEPALWSYLAIDKNGNQPAMCLFLDSSPTDEVEVVQNKLAAFGIHKRPSITVAWSPSQDARAATRERKIIQVVGQDDIVKLCENIPALKAKARGTPIPATFLEDIETRRRALAAGRAGVLKDSNPGDGVNPPAPATVVAAPPVVTPPVAPPPDPNLGGGTPTPPALSVGEAKTAPKSAPKNDSWLVRFNKARQARRDLREAQARAHAAALAAQAANDAQKPAEPAAPVISFEPAQATPKPDDQISILDHMKKIHEYFLNHPDYGHTLVGTSSFDIHSKKDPSKKKLLTVNPNNIEVHAHNEYAHVLEAVKLAAMRHNGSFVIRNSNPQFEALVARAIAELQNPKNKLKGFDDKEIKSLKVQVVAQNGDVSEIAPLAAPTGGSAGTVIKKAAAGPAI